MLCGDFVYDCEFEVVVVVFVVEDLVEVFDDVFVFVGWDVGVGIFDFEMDVLCCVFGLYVYCDVFVFWCVVDCVVD